MGKFLVLMLFCFMSFGLVSCGDQPGGSVASGGVTFEELTGHATDSDNQRTNLGLSDLLILHDLNTGTVRVRKSIWDKLSHADQAKVKAVFQKSQDMIGGTIDFVVE